MREPRKMTTHCTEHPAISQCINGLAYSKGAGMHSHMQTYHDTISADRSVTHLSRLRTIASIFLLYAGLMSSRYSGLISMAAYSKAVLFMSALWHSITVEVRMGTTCLGKRVMLRATLTSILAAPCTPQGLCVGTLALLWALQTSMQRCHC